LQGKDDSDKIVQLLCFVMKHPIFISAICAVVVSSLPQQAKALPFQPNCASMQAYANAVKWSNPTKFSGFENVRFLEYAGIYFCNLNGGGYVTETSPMGTRVCRASMQYVNPGPVNLVNPGLTWTPLNGSSSNCRWK